MESKMIITSKDNETIKHIKKLKEKEGKKKWKTTKEIQEKD